MHERILVGSCSWTDPSLIESGRFYPAEVRTPADRLRHYATVFPIVEVDSTYYAPPTERNARLWVERTPPGFVFNVKAYALLTGHPARVDRLPTWLRDSLTDDARDKRNVYARDLDQRQLDRLWEAHRAALAPLVHADRLGAVLFQFPYWFRRTRANEAYLAELGARLPGVRIAVQFRGGSWMDADAAATTLALLERHDLAYVSVDEPQGFRSSTPPLAAATSDLAVVRLHGRNTATWEARTARSADRFKYLYHDRELEEWVPRVRELATRAGTAHVLFNNNYQDWGMRNARRMTKLLAAGCDGGPRPAAPPAATRAVQDDGQAVLPLDERPQASSPDDPPS